MERAKCEMRLERWSDTRFFRSSQAIYASESQQCREVSEALLLKPEGLDLNPVLLH